MATAAVLLIGMTVLGNAHAATIEVTSTPRCTISLSGMIGEGDSGRLEAALTAAAADKDAGEAYLCLNSKGGSYSEALRMIDSILAGTSVVTVVDKGQECLSACALVFLSGFRHEGEGNISPARILHVRGILGFHTPYISATGTQFDEATAARIYREGVRAIGRLLVLTSAQQDREALFPRSLLGEALKADPHEFFYIDTVDKVGRWDIHLLGQAAPEPVTARMLQTACINYEAWRTWRTSATSDTDVAVKAPDTPTKLSKRRHRAKLPGYGAEGSFTCVVDVYVEPKQQVYLDVNLVSLMSEAPRPEDLRTLVKENPKNPIPAGRPAYYLYPPATRLKDLPTSPG